MPGVMRYGYGYIQGINAAAKEMGITDKVTVEYAYGGQFYGSTEITAAMDTWYSNRTEVVFACGGGIFTSAAEAAAKVGGKIIGVDSDQSPIIDSYGKGMTVAGENHKKDAVKNVSFQVREGEIVCIAGIDGNGQSELVYGLSGLSELKSGTIHMNGHDFTKASVRQRSVLGESHIPEDRHKHGLVLDYSLENNMVLQTYFKPQFTNKFGFLKKKEIRSYAERLIKEYDVRSSQGPVTQARTMSGGNQQKAIVAREIDKDPKFLIAVQPTRGVDVGAIELIHKQIVEERDKGKGVLLVSLELDEVMDVSDRILVMYEGEIVGEFKPEEVTVEELGLYMTGAKRQEN